MTRIGEPHLSCWADDVWGSSSAPLRTEGANKRATVDGEEDVGELRKPCYLCECRFEARCWGCCEVGELETELCPVAEHAMRWLRMQRGGLV